MDVSKVKAAIDEAHKQLNAVIDSEVQVARRFEFLNGLGQAAKALELASTHVNTVVEREAKKAAKAKAAAPAGDKKKK